MSTYHADFLIVGKNSHKKIDHLLNKKFKNSGQKILHFEAKFITYFAVLSSFCDEILEIWLFVIKKKWNLNENIVHLIKILAFYKTLPKRPAIPSDRFNNFDSKIFPNKKNLWTASIRLHRSFRVQLGEPKGFKHY